MTKEEWDITYECTILECCKDVLTMVDKMLEVKHLLFHPTPLPSFERIQWVDRSPFRWDPSIQTDWVSGPRVRDINEKVRRWHPSQGPVWDPATGDVSLGRMGQTFYLVETGKNEGWYPSSGGLVPMCGSYTPKIPLEGFPLVGPLRPFSFVWTDGCRKLKPSSW